VIPISGYDIAEMDFQILRGFFIISWTVGLVAHAHEEQTREKIMRIFFGVDYEYDGPSLQKLGENNL
jgi:citrate synthase